MKQEIGERNTATLVHGNDRFGHFNLAGPPSDQFAPEDMARRERALAAGKKSPLPH